MSDRDAITKAVEVLEGRALNRLLIMVHDSGDVPMKEVATALIEERNEALASSPLSSPHPRVKRRKRW